MLLLAPALLTCINGGMWVQHLPHHNSLRCSSSANVFLSTQLCIYCFWHKIRLINCGADFWQTLLQNKWFLSKSGISITLFLHIVEINRELEKFCNVFLNCGDISNQTVLFAFAHLLACKRICCKCENAIYMCLSILGFLLMAITPTLNRCKWPNGSIFPLNFLLNVLLTANDSCNSFSSSLNSRYMDPPLTCFESITLF